MAIELREKNKPEGKPFAIGSQSIDMFLDNGDATINIPLTRDDIVLGMLKFETFTPNQAIVVSTDSKYPHVKQGCAVCKDTHKGPAGANY